ncbi:peptidyl-prolyl cis-trans isomerase [Malonomonas rubra]|uniref:peptidylprolyl isomerase n=1 Tax=Malonomonas rubra TaxID=57040 RepID=UPI0026EB9651|nr:peptidyl-prolyl cis-trans isomerase [Malonomonas rubra]
MFYRSLFMAFFVLLLSTLLACQQSPPEKNPLLLKVGDRQLFLRQFERELRVYYPDLSDLPFPEQVQLKADLVRRLVERELIYAEAERIDVQVSPDELDAAMSELRGNYTAEEYQQVLRAAGQTEQSWKQILKQRLITQKVSAAILGEESKISETEAEKYYLDHKEEFRRPAELRARQMLFSNREDAEAVLKLLKAGGDFATLAREHSLSPDREDGGNLGYFSKGQLPPEFDKVLFTLGAGQYSDPVESPYGVHLFLVERRRKEGIRPYVVVKDEIVAKLSQQREEDAFQKWLEGLHNKAQVSVDWDLLKTQ